MRKEQSKEWESQSEASGCRPNAEGRRRSETSVGTTGDGVVEEGVRRRPPPAAATRVSPSKTALTFETLLTVPEREALSTVARSRLPLPLGGYGTF